MLKLLILAAVVCYGFKLGFGRWPWEPRLGARAQGVFNARKLLGLPVSPSREQILASHKRLVARVHPDRGGSSGQVHEANAARDLLLAELPPDSGA